MLKLMKYEFRKQVFSKLVILALLGLIEILFFFGIAADKENVLGTSVVFLMMFTFGALFFLAFESIITFSNDLKQKCSYMLFLTPNTSYSIVGAKVLSAGIQIILAGIAFVFVYAINGLVLVAKYESIAEVKRLFLELMNGTFNININTTDVLLVVTLLLLGWISTITVAFFSITLSTTFLANSKFKGIVSFVIFLAINYLFSKFTNLTLGNTTDNLTNTTLYLSLQSLYMLCFTIITYIGTAWMLEKRVSV